MKIYSAEELAAASEIGFDKDTLANLAKPDASNVTMSEYWNQVEAIIGGIKSMRLGGETYLPKLPDEPKKDYDFRLKNTKMTNVYRDIVESLASKPFAKETKLSDGENKTKPPSEMVKFAEDVDGSGNNLNVFASHYFFYGINNAIDWIFVDYLDANKEQIAPVNRPLTIAEENALGLRPYWSRIVARNMLEIRSRRVAGKMMLDFVRILQPKCATEGLCVKIIYRLNSIIKFQKWEATKPNEFTLRETGVYTIDVIPLVPFIVGLRQGDSWEFDPPMRDAADLQVDLYQQESDLKYLKVKCAFPMISASGIQPVKNKAGEIEPVNTGPNAILYSPPDGAGNHGEWKIIAADAAVMTYLESSIEKAVQNLREIGKQPLTAQSGNLTTITTAVAAGKAKSAIQSWAFALKDALENALVITAKWYKLNDYDPEVFVNTDIETYEDTSKPVDSLFKMRSTGDLSQESLWDELMRFRVLRDDFNKDVEKKRLAEESGGLEPNVNIDPNQA